MGFVVEPWKRLPVTWKSRESTYNWVMSASHPSYEWDLTVPGDGDELVAEFRRHGVLPGQRVHVAVVADDSNAADHETMPSFFNSFDGPPGLAEHSNEILQAEFPNH